MFDVYCCPHCDKQIMNRRLGQVTCGARSCRNAQARINKKHYRAEKTCAAPSCSKRFTAVRPEIVTCGAKKCQAEHSNSKKTLKSDLISPDIEFRNLFLKMPPLLTRDMYI